MNRNIAEIKSNPKNPRVIKDEKFAKLVQSLKDFPEMLEKRPLVCFTDTDGKLVVLGGNMRLKAAKEIGLKELPVIIADDWTEEQKAQFLIKDNVGFGEWNWDELQSDWDVEQLADWGLDIPSQFEVKAEAEEDDFDVPEGGIETDIVLGDLFEIGQHRLLCGDSTDSDAVARLMDGQKADMVFTDPPYRYKKMGDGGAFHEGHKKLKEDIKDIVNFDPTEFLNTLPLVFSKGINAYVFCNTDLVPDYCLWAKENKYNFNILTWHKKSFIPASNNHHFPDTEYLIYISKGAIFNSGLNVNYGKYFILDNEKSNDHPTIKPLEIIAVQLQIGSNINSVVMDFFLGSGSTMVAAHQLNRKCYGMELDPKYCQVIIDRMKKLDPSITIKKNGNAI
jgi:site-specific DNA-methyltransferase (adenine-specific)